MELKVSTGISGFDRTIDSLRLGDNVVWQVDYIENYRDMVIPFVNQAIADNRKVVYVRFGDHPPLLEQSSDVVTYEVDANMGFEGFATEVHRLIENEGTKTFYVFDSLTDLLSSWYSDLMIGNFFRVCCPYLYELHTIAYFAIHRNVHTYSTIARIRETTQVLLDLYVLEDKHYVHPLKVWQRYSPTMFFPHLIEDHHVKSITASSEASELFSNINRVEEKMDYWHVLFARAKEDLDKDRQTQEKTKRLLMSLLMGGNSRMFELCDQYFTLHDILQIASREVGTGFIGGKSVGMLLARKILKEAENDRFRPYLEAHDSFYIGSDIFYTFIVQNGWWKLRVKQKTKEGYYKYAKELREKILTGTFPANIKEQFVQLLEYFGQSPIIVRSSSLLEDNFGNAFAGKYESVFCVNQGTPEERYQAFEDAIRTVYASTMNEEALEYRMNRGLFDKDEQMAILVQRVSGDHYGDHFFPHIAGVGNSSNLYVWDQNVDMDAGMIRLVFGLGTRAVDRTVDDYARIVTLDQPTRKPLMHMDDAKKFSQHGVDALSIRNNQFSSIKADDAIAHVWDVERDLFASLDTETMFRLKELGYKNMPTPYIFDFHKLLKHSSFPNVMRDMLAEIATVYEYPVDVEFTANFQNKDEFKLNLVQCRPLQTKGLGQSVQVPDLTPSESCFIQTAGHFMGGNIRLPVDYVVIIDINEYLYLSDQDKHGVARQIGQISRYLKEENLLLVGPGRWGTSTPSLGVPVHFTEIQHADAIFEVASEKKGFSPELSYGSHFFQDIVESDIFYGAVFDGHEEVRYDPSYITNEPNLLLQWDEKYHEWKHVIHVAQVQSMELVADIVRQKLVCR
ncbi:pyruvate phosphate dikinase PEP/pyruvate-binding protein [Gracilibacillus halophilus YIM-C55.5]|uniref:Pyruvate phosphate dikinase PEP/pyruvate-binding protein n=1 Tax=Gracilibacillus halophilus YIM-C55.5 TaxID=1308866 RepID=N4WF40_9BACI|nr:PEP/pyruvate-binding domain-containing protein [Gracilibacillus halophilus]ENH97889.1 pyruvate phosphate dikinase PEP/pyruvate-binding protein [Gracilibacillus halophilus YIM-C55.5]